MSKGTISADNTSPNILVPLKEAQARFGYVSREFMTELAVKLDVPVNDVYGVASFYSFLFLKPAGRNVIRICKSLPCHLKEGRAVIDAIGKELGIRPGQITPDGRFSFELTNCIGLCDNAPAMLLNGEPHVSLTPDKISKILNDYK